MPLILYDLPKKWDIPDSNKFLDYPAYIEYSKGHDKVIGKILKEIKRKFKLLELENELLHETIKKLNY